MYESQYMLNTIPMGEPTSVDQEDALIVHTEEHYSYNSGHSSSATLLWRDPETGKRQITAFNYANGYDNKAHGDVRVNAKRDHIRIAANVFRLHNWADNPTYSTVKLKRSRKAKNGIPLFVYGYRAGDYQRAAQILVMDQNDQKVWVSESCIDTVEYGAPPVWHPDYDKIITGRGVTSPAKLQREKLSRIQRCKSDTNHYECKLTVAELRAIAVSLRDIGTGKTKEVGAGLCNHVAVYLSNILGYSYVARSELCRLIISLSSNWEHYSGVPQYPIKITERAVKTLREKSSVMELSVYKSIHSAMYHYYELLGEDEASQLSATKYLWSGEYGDLRRQLAIHIADELEKVECISMGSYQCRLDENENIETTLKMTVKRFDGTHVKIPYRKVKGKADTYYITEESVDFMGGVAAKKFLESTELP